MAGPIRIAVLANASQAKRELNSTATTAEKISGRFSKLRLPAAAVLGGIALGAKAATSAASDLNEEVSKSQQIFGDQAKDIERFAASAAKSLGQSKREALSAAGTFGLIGQKAGLSGQETAAFAKRFTGLASDLASFNNTTPEEAITAIGAAMRGESEPIRKYGVLLDDATLRARALKLGLISTVKQGLTPQQKALAASEEILAQTTKAQGDFARTSDGAANKARINAAAAENLRAKLGQGLLPAYTKLLTIANGFLDVMTAHPTATKVAVIAVASLAVGTLALSKAIAVYNLVTKLQAINTKRAAAGQAAFNLTMLANPVVLVVAAVVALVAGFVILYKRSERVREATHKVLDVFKAVGKFIGTILLKYLRTLATVWLTFGIVAVQALKAVLTAAFTTFEGILKAADKGLGWIPGIGGKIKKAKDAFVDFKDGTIGALDKVEGKLVTTRDKVNALGRAKAKPTIDTGSIDRANAKLSGMLQRLREIGANLTANILAFGTGGSSRTSSSTAERIAIASSPAPAPAGITIEQLVVQVPVGATAEDIGRELVAYLKAYFLVGGERP